MTFPTATPIAITAPNLQLAQRGDGFFGELAAGRARLSALPNAIWFRTFRYRLGESRRCISKNVIATLPGSVHGQPPNQLPEF
jgi:hypothetical protein